MRLEPMHMQTGRRAGTEGGGTRREGEEKKGAIEIQTGIEQIEQEETGKRGGREREKNKRRGEMDRDRG